MSWLSSLIGIGGNFATSAYNNWQAEQAQKRARQDNYMYNEMAAKNANQRWRENYKDFFTPSAQLDMIKEAGLSPSLMMSGGIGGGGSAASPQGMGAQGLQSNYFPVSAMEMAQIGLMKAETAKINEDTITAQLNNEITKLENQTFANKWHLLNGQSGHHYYNTETGMMTSLSDIANSAKDYNEFEQNVLKYYNGDSNVFLSSEEGRQTLRDIYETNKKFGNDISVLANSEANAQLMLKVTNLLNNNNFAKESANAQLQQLKQVAESAELTEKQKGAMNRLIDKLGHNTGADILLVMLMVLGQYSHTILNFGVSQAAQIKK